MVNCHIVASNQNEYMDKEHKSREAERKQPAAHAVENAKGYFTESQKSKQLSPLFTPWAFCDQRVHRRSCLVSTSVVDSSRGSWHSCCSFSLDYHRYCYYHLSRANRRQTCPRFPSHPFSCASCSSSPCPTKRPFPTTFPTPLSGSRARQRVLPPRLHHCDGSSPCSCRAPF